MSGKSVKPNLNVETLTVSEISSENEEAKSLLIMTINDLGADIDERSEYVNQFDNFEVYVNPEETPDEEEAVSQAVTHVDSFLSKRNVPHGIIAAAKALANQPMFFLSAPITSKAK